MLDVTEEAVALVRDLARPGLEPLDRTRDRRQRRPQLMSGVVDELALGAPPLFSLRDVRHHEQRRLGAGGRNPRQVEHTRAVGTRQPGPRRRARRPEETGGEVVEWEAVPALGDALAFHERRGAQHPLGVRARELDAAATVDTDNPFVQPFDEASQPAPPVDLCFVELGSLDCLCALAAEREHERTLRLGEPSRPGEAEEEHSERAPGQDERDVSAGPRVEVEPRQRRRIVLDVRVVVADVLLRLDEHRLETVERIDARQLQIDREPAPALSDQRRIRALPEDDLERLPVGGEQLERAGVSVDARNPLRHSHVRHLVGVSATASSAASSWSRIVLLIASLAAACACRSASNSWARSSAWAHWLASVFRNFRSSSSNARGSAKLSAITPIGRPWTCRATNANASWPAAARSRANSGDAASAAAADSK